MSKLRSILAAFLSMALVMVFSPAALPLEADWAELIKQTQEQLDRIEKCACGQVSPDPSPDPDPGPAPPLDPDPPEEPGDDPAPPSLPLKGHRWEASTGNPDHVGQWLLLLPSSFKNKVKSAQVSGKVYAYERLYKGKPLFYGPAKSSLDAPYVIKVTTKDGKVYESDEGGSSGGGGGAAGWDLPSGLVPGDTSGRAHNNPNAWKKGYYAIVAGEDTPGGSMYIYQRNKSPIKGSYAGEDHGRKYWIWADKGLAKRLTKPIYLVHSKGYYYYIKDPTKKYYGSDLNGPLP